MGTIPTLTYFLMLYKDNNYTVNEGCSYVLCYIERSCSTCTVIVNIYKKDREI